MSIAEIASIIAIAEFGAKVISRLKTKTKKHKVVRHRTKQTKDEQLIAKLLTNPELAIKEMGAEYLVKNRKKIIKNIGNRIVNEFLE